MSAWLWVAVAGAGEPASSPNTAEYVRLSQELSNLATRNAWGGVERVYKLVVQTGHEPSFADHLAGAHAARSRGDVTVVRERLFMANAQHTDKEVVNWLWEIDANYGRVSLACDSGKNQATLEIEEMPFEPEVRRAIEFAQARIEETCLFDGLIPGGAYTFGGYDLKVAPRVQTVLIDLRDKKRRPKKGRGEEELRAP